MEYDGTEVDQSSSSSDLAEVSGDIPQDADKKFGTYSRDFEDGDTEMLTDADNGATDLSGANQKISMVSWFKIEAFPGTDQGIICNWQYFETRYQFAHYLATGANNKITFILSSDSDNLTLYEQGDTALDTATWYHFASVYNDSTASVYLDGSLDSTAQIETAGIGDDTATLSWGAFNQFGGTLNEIDGLLDDVAMFSDDLSSTEVNDIMDNGLEPVAVTRRIMTVM